MFLVRAAFWLAVVVLLLPGDPNSGADAPRVTAVEALMATRSAVADFSGFCERNPDTCATGSTAVQVFVSKVRYGADLISGYINHKDEAVDRGTLRQQDTEPAWRTPEPQHNGAA